jgi:hypothetical protein
MCLSSTEDIMPTTNKLSLGPPEANDIEPLALTIRQVEKATSESRSQVYNRIGRGEYTAVKSGRRTLVLYDSVKRHIGSLPPARIKSPPARPTLADRPGWPDKTTSPSSE